MTVTTDKQANFIYLQYQAHLNAFHLAEGFVLIIN